MTLKVHDNFLNEEQFLFLNSNILHENFPWYFNNYKIYNHSNLIHDFQFTHTLYNNFQIQSDYFFIVKPILEKINPISLIRIKLNLTTVFDKIISHPFHTDVSTNTKTKTGIFYLNTNNGKTIFKNNDEVESKKNRFVEFPSNLEHAATTHSNTKTRIVINLNWV